MTERELREIKRRFRPERSNIPRIVGCIVNSNKVIISKITQGLDFSDSAAAEKLLSVMKKALSGSIGTNLTDITFTTKQVSESEEHKLLMELRKSELKDEAILEKFYAKVIASLNFDGNYAILLANDLYDVITRSSDGEGEKSTEVFSYIVTAICPIKNLPEALAFREADSLFHIAGASSALMAPELGFMFPAFDDRRTNIYGALYYTRSLSESYGDFTRSIFANEPPMPPKLQKETFSDCLSDSLGAECTLDVIRSIHAQVAEMTEAHKEAKIPEPLTLSKGTVKMMLENCGIEEEKTEKAAEAFEESFGINAEVAPKNVISQSKFEIKTPDVTIKVSPEGRDLVSTETIGGKEYILIKVTGGVEINGINLSPSEN